MAHNLGSFVYETDHTLRYWLFPHDSVGSPILDKDELEKLSTEYMAYLLPDIECYIWNYDTFSLNVKMGTLANQETSVLSPHLCGIMEIGDGIQDVWFVVYLLQQLTKAKRGLVCRITDTDGEFLLIEAADFLPSWAEHPKTAGQRVYIKNGKVHLVPLSVCSSNPTPVMEAVSRIQKRPSSTLASPNINKAVDRRTNGYPKKISSDQHVAHAYLPVGVAALLREYPTLVSASVRSFCKRDQGDTKCLRIMRHFPPEQRVLSAVRFPKLLYAQVVGRVYQPTRGTGWNLPLPDHPSYDSHVLGMKLACGFEILVSSAGGISPTTSNGTSSESLIDVKDNPKWINYKKSLDESGYFRGELEGSQLYQELLENAQRFFVSSVLTSKHDENSEDDLSIGSVIVKLLSKINIDYEYYKKREEKLTPAGDVSWLSINSEDLDNVLKSESGEPASATPSSENEMMEGLSSFMNQMSDWSGVEIPPELRDSTRKVSTDSRKIGKTSRKISTSQLDSRKVSSQSNASDVSTMSSFSNKIDRNSDAFTDTFRNILTMEVPEDKYFRDSDDDSSGMSSYDEDDKDISLSRKTSDGSNSSSGVDTDMRDYMKQMDKELKSRGEIDPTPLADMDDEFHDVEDFDSVSVDINSIKNLIKSYHEQSGNPGPASTMFGAMGLNPKK